MHVYTDKNLGKSPLTITYINRLPQQLEVHDRLNKHIPQVLQEIDASTAAADYSRIDPSYETIDLSSSRRQQPVAAAGRRNVVGLARLSERYEFSEPHLAMVSAMSGGRGDGGGVQGEAAAVDYEVPYRSEEHERTHVYSIEGHGPVDECTVNNCFITDLLSTLI